MYETVKKISRNKQEKKSRKKQNKLFFPLKNQHRDCLKTACAMVEMVNGSRRPNTHAHKRMCIWVLCIYVKWCIIFMWNENVCIYWIECKTLELITQRYLSSSLDATNVLLFSTKQITYTHRNHSASWFRYKMMHRDTNKHIECVICFFWPGLLFLPSAHYDVVDIFLVMAEQ